MHAFYPRATTPKKENPALINDQNEVLASTPSVSPERQVWGLLLGGSQIFDVQLVQLVARIYVRKRQKREISIDLPFT